MSMENLKKLISKIQTFYALVETHENVIQNLIKEVKKPLHSITNQSIFYRAVVPKNSVLNTPFEHIEGFRESLIDSIFIALQEEYNLLENFRNDVNNANEKLHREQIFLESLFSDLNSKNLIDYSNLNPCSPAFEHIILWSHDVWCYYHSYYLQITQALTNLNYEEETTVICLTQSFKEDTELKNQINKIRSFKFSEFEFIL